MENENLLEIKQLVVRVGDKEIIHGIDLCIKRGETHVIFGPNGGGKTTLLMTIMGFPRYEVTSGKIIFKGKDITHMPIDERARLGIGISFQRPPVVRGVKTRDLAAACIRGVDVDKKPDMVDELARKANMVDFLERDINHGFSGGEIKRSEMMQLLAQNSELALLDEPESGVDLENIALIGDMINLLLDKRHPMNQRSRSGLIISHTGHILDYVNARTGYVLCGGRFLCDGDPHEILESIKNKGYNACVSCLRRTEIVQSE